ncbi:MAG: hypothetical protein FWG87_02745 [Defluviitaleaceae bacterium]|nr:hypothetical protein [Defluviitaleaceae bacterium]
MSPLNDDNFNDSLNAEKKSKGGIIALAVIILLVGALIVVLAFDIGGVRENHIMRYLRNAPLIGSLFSQPEAEEADPLNDMSEDEMRQMLTTYRQQIQSLENQRAERDQRISAMNTRIAHLEDYESRWNEYRVASAAFADMLAQNEPLGFVRFFEDIVRHDLVPEDILAIAYARAEAINTYDEELQQQISTYNNMQEKRAAENLSRLMTTNTTLAVRILRGMGSARRAAIFDEMDVNVSTTFTILLSTEPPTFAPLVPPTVLAEVTEPIVTPPPTPIPIEEAGEEAEEEAEEETEEAENTQETTNE